MRKVPMAPAEANEDEEEEEALACPFMMAGVV